MTYTQLNKSQKLTMWLLLLLFVAGLANAAVTYPSSNIIRFGATADTVTFTTSPGAANDPIVQITFTPSATGKGFRLRNGSSTGAVVWETTSSATTKVIEDVVIRPPITLYFESDDTTFSGLTCYKRVGNQ
jgi:hypothetical protein